MNITIYSAGKERNYMGEDIVLEFTSRISHYSKIEWKYSIPKTFPDNSYIVALDEMGKEMTSIELGTFLQKRLNASVKNIVFVIGGAYGIDKNTREKAHFLWSLGKLTYPHELVRSILAEQIYRAFSIIKGEKYHHG